MWRKSHFGKKRETASVLMSAHLSRLIGFCMLCSLSSDVTQTESMTNHFSLMQGASMRTQAREQVLF